MTRCDKVYTNEDSEEASRSQTIYQKVVQKGRKAKVRAKANGEKAERVRSVQGQVVDAMSAQGKTR